MRATFNKAAIRLFDTFGDLIEGVVYSSIGPWDPTTESNTAVTQPDLRISARPPKREEADATGIMVGDLVALVIQSEMTATPKIDDRLALDGVDYIVRAVVDSHKVLWRLSLRRL
jgi:putative aminopeptidase FrvX